MRGLRGREQPPGQETGEHEEERAWLTAIVDQMPGGLIVVEAPGGRILTVNEQARQLLGPIDENGSFHGLRGVALRPDGSRYEFGETPLARALEGEVVAAERIEVTRPGGRRLVFRVSASPVRDRANRVTAAISMFEDVTEGDTRDRAEREFVTNAAHELQSPIAAITSAVDVLQAGAKDTSQRDLFLTHIEREAQRLVRLTGALLTLSRVQTGVEEPRTEVVDLCPMLEAIAERMEPAEGVTLTVDCPPELALVANRELLEQLISNVVRNAVKYTETGSIRLEGKLHGGRVEVLVADTGIGIPADALPRVAERFFRGEPSKEGFGLGLSIVQAALDVMGGELSVASAGPGRGTTVTMSLPLGAKRVAP